MGVHSISGLNKPIFTSSAYNPVGQHTKYSQPILGFESYIKSGPVMSESSCVRHIFLDPVKRTSHFRPKFNQKIPKQEVNIVSSGTL